MLHDRLSTLCLLFPTEFNNLLCGHWHHIFNLKIGSFVLVLKLSHWSWSLMPRIRSNSSEATHCAGFLRIFWFHMFRNISSRNFENIIGHIHFLGEFSQINSGLVSFVHSTEIPFYFRFPGPRRSGLRYNQSRALSSFGSGWRLGLCLTLGGCHGNLCHDGGSLIMSRQISTVQVIAWTLWTSVPGSRLLEKVSLFLLVIRGCSFQICSLSSDSFSLKNCFHWAVSWLTHVFKTTLPI